MPNITIVSTATAIKLSMGDYSAAPVFNGASDIIFYKAQIVKVWKYPTYIEITFTDGNAFKFAHAPLAADPEVMVVDKVNNLPLVGNFLTLDALFTALWGIA